MRQARDQRQDVIDSAEGAIGVKVARCLQVDAVAAGHQVMQLERHSTPRPTLAKSTMPTGVASRLFKLAMAWAFSAAWAEAAAASSKCARHQSVKSGH
jgi:hypothetical protein